MIKYLSLFTGIGAFESALENLKIQFELVGFSEIDRYAVESYLYMNNINQSKNLGDITKIDASKIEANIDLLSYGFPCQDISSAGKQKGFIYDGKITRSGLFFDALRIIKTVKPKVAIAENVKNLVGKRFTKEFDIVLDSLNEAGYNNYWAILNAKDYGVPQQRERERVFIVSIRKDCDNGLFKFPKKYPLKLRLKDILEDEVDERYFIKKANNIVIKDRYIQWDNSGKNYNSQQDRAYFQDGIAPTLSYCNSNGDKSQVLLLDKPILVGQVSSKNSQCGKVYDANGTSMTLTSGTHGYAMGNVFVDGKIRKLTPRECFKLMGFKDSQFDKIKGISNTQLYKQAGNSIVVDVVEELLCMLFDEDGNLMI